MKSARGLAPFLVTLAVMIVAAFFVLRDNLRAAFGPIDDHEIVEWLGPDGRISIADGIPTWLGTEVGAWPDVDRYRPFYYLVRVLETSILGGNATAWYVTHMIIFALTCAILGATFGWAFSQALGRSRGVAQTLIESAAAVVGSYAFFGLSTWSGIITRLGPAELLGLLGVALVLLGSLGIVTARSDVWWISLVLGSWMAALSKETFVGFLLLPVIVGAYRYLSNGRNWTAIAGVSLCLAPAILLAPTFLQSSDLYGRSSGASRVSVGLEAAFKVFPGYWVPAALSLSLALALWSVAIRGHETKVVWVAWLSFGWLVSVVIADLILNGGEYPANRYWAVFQTAKVVMILASICFGTCAVRMLQGRRRILPATSLLLSIVLLGSLAAANAQGVSQLGAEARLNADATRRYAQQVHDAIRILTEKDGAQFLIVIPQVAEFEPAKALATDVFVRTAGQSRTFLDVGALLPAGSDGNAKSLVHTATNGDPGWHVSAKAGLTPTAGVLCAFINAEPSVRDDCTLGAVRIDARGM